VFVDELFEARIVSSLRNVFFFSEAMTVKVGVQGILPLSKFFMRTNEIEKFNEFCTSLQDLLLALVLDSIHSK
jgi:hypothetical protein